MVTTTAQRPSRSLRTYLLLLVTLLLTLFAGGMRANASTVATSGLTANDAVITNDTGVKQSNTTSLDTYSAYKVDYQWTIANGVTVKNGDTATVELPANVQPSYTATFDLTDPETHAKVGSFDIQKDHRTGTLTFNDYFATHVLNRHGTLEIAANGKTVNKTDNANWMLNKIGWLTDQTLKDGHPTTANWNVAFNPNGKDLTNVVLTDTLGSDQTFVAGSVKAETGTFKDGQFTPDGHTVTPTITTKGNVITMTFAHVTTGINLNYQATITGIPSENHWSNEAQMTALNGQTPINALVHGTIAWGGDGTGTGTQQPVIQQGSVKLVKTDAKCGNLLADAHYNLYTAAGKLVKADLTTNNAGEINVAKLDYGQYYFVETQAPDGYQLSTKQAAFTINAQTPAPIVHVSDTKKPACHHDDGDGSGYFFYYEHDTFNYHRTILAPFSNWYVDHSYSIITNFMLLARW